MLTTVAPLDIVVDVGGVYDADKDRYDHHQRGFTEVFGHGGFNQIKLSSAGLVYKFANRNMLLLTLGTLASTLSRASSTSPRRRRRSRRSGCSCTLN